MSKDPNPKPEVLTIEALRELVPKELKHKGEIPTVIEYKGKRYILDMKRR